MMGKSLCCTKDCKSLRWTKHQRLVVGILHGGQGIFIKIQRQDIVHLFSHSTGQGVGHEVCREAARTDLKRGGARRILGELKVKVTVTRLLYFTCLLPAHCPENGTKESRKGRERHAGPRGVCCLRWHLWRKDTWSSSLTALLSPTSLPGVPEGTGDRNHSGLPWFRHQRMQQYHRKEKPQIQIITMTREATCQQKKVVTNIISFLSSSIHLWPEIGLNSIKPI